MSLERVFSANMAYVFGQVMPKTVAVALSGGVDSMSLVHLLDRYRNSHGPFEIKALTVNHNLRPESGEEAYAVGKAMRSLGVSHEVHELEWGPEPIKAMEEQARFKRYRALQSFCHENGSEFLLTGHHLDDQLETFVQRLRYGSSVFGLRGMKMLSHLPVADLAPPQFLKPVQLARPLLSVPKNSLVDYCKANGLEWFEDPTNSKAITARNVIREWLAEAPDRKIEILDSLKQVVTVGDSLDADVARLDRELKAKGLVSGILNSMSLTVVLPADVFTRYDPLVINRYLYRTCFLISPSTNYAYKFGKFDSSFNLDSSEPTDLSKNLKTILDSGETSHFTLMNLHWKCTPIRDALEMKLAREAQRTYKYSNTRNSSSITLLVAESGPGLSVPLQGWSQWFLFDNRCWLRMRLRSPAPEGLKSFRVSNYTGTTADLDIFDESETGPRNQMQRRVKNQPVVTYVWKDDEREKIAGFPTWNTWSPWIKDLLEVEWLPKGEYQEGKPMVFTNLTK